MEQTDEKGFTLEIDPDEGEYVEKIFVMYLAHNGTKIIANYLNGRKVSTQHSELRTYSTVSNIIANLVCIGKIRRDWKQQFNAMENGTCQKAYNVEGKHGQLQSL